MRLKEIVRDFSCNINTLPIAKYLNNNLPRDEYENLYQYFMDERERYYHALVKVQGEQVLKEEFCLLLNDDNEENDVENRSDYVKFYEFDYEMKINILTIYVCLTDYFTQSEVRIPFAYDLKDTMILFELNEFLKQDKTDLFFIQLINNNLTIEHHMECFISNEFKINLESVINKFLDDRPVVSIDDILDKVEDYEYKGKVDYQKYNWVDVKEFAKEIFWNYDFEMAWAEDAWNILMFNGIVKSDNIVKAKHEPYEYGDIILWLVAMYDLYFDYKVAADYESMDEANINEYIYRLDNAEKYIGIYLKDEIYEELNNQLIEGNCNQCEFYDIETNNFVFVNDDTGTSIAYDVYYNEIQRRREIVNNIIRKHFNKNNVLISEFMEGTHWCENYLDNEKKRQKIIDKYEKILEYIKQGKIVQYNICGSEYEYIDENEVNEDMQNELEELENEMDEYMSDAQQGEVYAWIFNGMSL